MSANNVSEKQLFAEALRLSRPEERAAFLVSACGDHLELRQRIETLLAASDEAGGFLQESAVKVSATTRAVTPDALLTEKAGDKIGRYKLREQIGEGGCGVVYVAEQEEPVRRRVALKVIKLGMDTKQVVARFEAERQALALMDHPNIAKVLDAGATESGRPYFVMELVRGIKITDYCDKNNLSTEERLKLFLPICSAIQHAHQKGIIHRDIKPSNILVTLHDGVPVPKVIDFGIAKATSDQRLTDKTIYTAFEQFIGTPAYMSPEQAEMSGLDIDTRSDIYSLGVLLYELLAGSPPFDPEDLVKAGLVEMRRTIREKEPPRPSTRLSHLTLAELTTVASRHHEEARRLISSLRGDLDWIVMKALEKDRVRRYENVAGFAQDVKRYLSSEPVAARPPSSLYRFQKMVRRNKLFAASIGLLIIGLAGWASWISVLFRESQLREADKQARIATAEKTAQELRAALGQAHQYQLLQESQAIRLTARFAGWSERAWACASNATQVPTTGNRDYVRDQAAAALAGLDAQRTTYFPGLGASRVLFDREGRRLLMGSLGDGAHLWDGSTNAPLVVTNHPKRAPVAFADGGAPAQLLYDSSQKYFRLTDLINGRSIRAWPVPPQLDARLKSGAPLKMSALSTDGSVAAAVLKLTDGKEAIVVIRGDSARVLGESATTVSALAISSDRSFVAFAESGGGVSMISVWSVDTGQRIDSLTGGRNDILSLALKSVERTVAAALGSKGENTALLLAAGDAGGDVTIHDIRSKTILNKCRGGHYQIFAVTFSPDGTTLASGGRGPVKLWDVATGEHLLDITTGDYITSLDFSPDGLRLAIGTAAGAYPKQVSVWTLEYGRGISSLRGLSGQIAKVCFSGDGRRIAALSHKWEIGIWDSAKAELLRVVEAPLGSYVDNAAIALDSSGERLAFSGSTNARLWDVQSGRLLKSLTLPQGLADVLAFPNPDHLLLFRAEGFDRDPHTNVCRIRDLLAGADPKLIAEMPDFDGGVHEACWSPKGTWLVVDGSIARSNRFQRFIKGYEAVTGREGWSLPLAKTGTFGVIIPDTTGNFVAAQTDNTLASTLLEMESGSVVKQYPWTPCAVHLTTGVAAAPGHLPPLASQGDSERGCRLFFDFKPTPAVTFALDQPAPSKGHFDSSGNLLTWGNTDATVTVCNLKEINARLRRINLNW